MFDLTTTELAMLNEFGESDAWANYYLCAPTEFTNKFRLEVKASGTVKVSVIPDFDLNIFNRNIGLGIGTPAIETDLDEAIGAMHNAGV